MGYTMATIKALVDSGAVVHVVHWDHKKLTPYQMSNYKNVNIYSRSLHPVESLISLVEDLKPDITVVSGWQDKGYLSVARLLRKRGRLVVCGFDDQWHSSPKQRVGAILGLAGFFYRYFSHAWVTGVYQYEYARRLGFQKQDIVFDLYSADLPSFHRSYKNRLGKNPYEYPRKFLFVGRLEHIKGLDTLFSAWKQLGLGRGDWQLHLIGSGSLKNMSSGMPGVVVKDFMQPEQLVSEITNAGCFILPSRGEPWGVVVHEFAAAGLPLILSDVVGAASAFLVPGLNGYLFKSKDADALAERMRQIIACSDEQLIAMSTASYQLSGRITPQTSAANLLSIKDQKYHE